MMTWFSKRKWSRRKEDQERKALAASVEELTARAEGENRVWEEEEDEVPTDDELLIPPLLHLQSRPLPVVRIDVTKRGPGREAQGQEKTSPEVTSSKRLGHSTKVRLQAVHVKEVQKATLGEPTTERVQIVDAPASEPRATTPEAAYAAEQNETGQNSQRLVRKIGQLAVAPPASFPSSLFWGSGIIEAGAEDATIRNQRISAQSVVTVMLAGNPGPVVVHYVSLQPRAGFTLHLSAPVSVATPFNYAVWLF